MDEIRVEDEVNKYGELWTQTFHGAYAIDLGTSAGDDLPTDWNPSPTVMNQAAPLGGRLEQNQVAEMVSLIPDAVGAWFREEGDLEPVPQTAEVEFEVSNRGLDHVTDNATFGPGFTMDGISEDTWTQSNAYSEQSYGKKLWFAFCTATDAFADEVAGPYAGGSGGGQVHSPMTPINYRDWYGRGPLLDDGDELRLQAGIRVNNAADATLAYMCRYRVVWDVFEYPRGGLSETQGPDIPSGD